MQHLETRWLQFAGQWGATTTVTTELYVALAKGYSARGRHYHTLAHVSALLDWLSRCAAQLGAEVALVEAAIWYHDAIYVARRRDNESRSAELALTQLAQLGAPATLATQTASLIRATAQHQPDDADWQRWLAKPALDAAGRWFLDFDLSILGSAPAVYEQYSAAIRREYAWVPFPLYRHKRAQALQTFLQRPQLYLTSYMRERLEAQARANLSRELAQLTA